MNVEEMNKRIAAIFDEIAALENEKSALQDALLAAKIAEAAAAGGGTIAGKVSYWVMEEDVRGYSEDYIMHEREIAISIPIGAEVYMVREIAERAIAETGEEAYSMFDFTADNGDVIVFCK